MVTLDGGDVGDVRAAVELVLAKTRDLTSEDLDVLRFGLMELALDLEGEGTPVQVREWYAALAALVVAEQDRRARDERGRDEKLKQAYGFDGPGQ